MSGIYGVFSPSHPHSHHFVALRSNYHFYLLGSAIYLWGNTLPDHGRFKVTLTSPDEPETTAIYQGRTKFTTVEALIYFRGGLNSSSTHNLTIENLDDSYLDVVRAVVATGEERHTYRGGKCVVHQTLMGL